jgi:hypothetical protein
MKKLSFALAVLLIITALPAASASESAGDDVTKMLPVFDSLIRVLLDEDAVYDPRDPDFFWNAVYLTAVNWESFHPLAEISEDWVSLMLPVQLVQELAAALFADYDGLPNVPETVSGAVSYDEPLGIYSFTLSDMGETYSQIDASKHADDGSLSVIVLFKAYGEGEEDEVLGRFEFTVQPNERSVDIEEPEFLYSVVSAARFADQ